MQDLGVGFRRRVAAFAPAVLVAYLGLLTAGALGHHDIRCHLKSTTHCTACVQAPVAGAHVAGPITDGPLAAAGAAPAARVVCSPPLVVAEAGGRAPPLS